MKTIKKISMYEHENRRTEWEEIKEKYSQFFIDNESARKTMFNELDNFISINETLPNSKSKNKKEKTLGIWDTDTKL